MITAGFSTWNSLEKVWFFEETFLLDDTNMKVVLEMLFLKLSNVNIKFAAGELIWRSYTIIKAPIAK